MNKSGYYMVEAELFDRQMKRWLDAEDALEVTYRHVSNVLETGYIPLPCPGINGSDDEKPISEYELGLFEGL